jgi:hypothetical protein
MAGILAAVCFNSVLWAQTAPGPTWKDQGESDIGLAAGNEQDPARKLELLKKWEQQYPNTALAAQRTFMTTQALTGLITGAFGKQEGPVLDAGRKAAQQLIDGIGTYFDDSLRSLPQLAQMSPAEWTKIRSTSEMQAHALMAYAAALKKDTVTAETEYKKVLAIDPTQAATSYQWGALIIHEMLETKNFVRYSEALYELARSLSVEGPNALPPDARAKADKALKSNYANYHGGPDGLDDLLKQSARSALPPMDFIFRASSISTMPNREITPPGLWSTRTWISGKRSARKWRRGATVSSMRPLKTLQSRLPRETLTKAPRCSAER